MLNIAHTCTASAMAASDSPAARSGVTSSGPIASGVSVSFSRYARMARSLGSIGAVS
jgi:hypothetical protein